MTNATITREIADGTLDADLAALLWLLGEAGVPLTVTGPPGSGRRRLRAAIVGLHGRAGWSVPAQPGGGGIHDAASLEDLFTTLASPPHGLSADEQRELGAVVVTGLDEGRRVVAAHYIRPVERDREGHLQRRPPALLSAWDSAGSRLEHFHWGVTSELAARAGMSSAVFEATHAERSSLLRALADAGVTAPEALGRALDGYLFLGAAGQHEGH